MQQYPGFSIKLLDNDVAILKIDPPILESPTIEFAKLPQNISDPQAGIKRVAGWYVAVGSHILIFHL